MPNTVCSQGRPLGNPSCHRLAQFVPVHNGEGRWHRRATEMKLPETAKCRARLPASSSTRAGQSIRAESPECSDIYDFAGESRRWTPLAVLLYRSSRIRFTLVHSPSGSLIQSTFAPFERALRRGIERCVGYKH